MNGPSIETIVETVARWRAAMPYFPKDPLFEADLSRLLKRMTHDDTRLRWLATAVLDYFEKWPSLAELRSLYATKYEPADGVPAAVVLPGYSASDLETKYEQAQLADDNRRLEAYQQQAVFLPEAERFQLPAPRSLPLLDSEDDRHPHPAETVIDVAAEPIRPTRLELPAVSLDSLSKADRDALLKEPWFEDMRNHSERT